jgi:Ca2+-binding EF-hand superfamily protein
MKKLFFVMALIVAVGVQADFTSGQVKKFERSDTDGNGTLNSEEFDQVVKQRFEDNGKSDWEDAAAKQFKNKDQDKDGALTLEEFWSTAKKK